MIPRSILRLLDCRISQLLPKVTAVSVNSNRKISRTRVRHGILELPHV